MHIAKMNYSRLVAAYISLTLVGCLLAGVYAPPASADPVTDSDGISPSDSVLYLSSGFL